MRDARLPPSKDPRVLREIVALLYGNAAVGIVMNLLAVPLIGFAYFGLLPPAWLFGALFLWAATQGASAWNRSRWNALSAEEKHREAVVARFLARARRMAWLLALGMSFLLGVLHFASAPATPALAAAFALVYVLGACISTLIYLPQIKTFSTLVLGSQALLLFIQPSATEILLALLFMALIAGLWMYGRRYSEQFQQTIVLRFEVQDLLAEQARLRAIAEAAHEAKSRFFAAASHDVRQPLQALLLNSHALRHAGDDAARRAKLLDNSERNLSALRELFDQVLDISRIDAGALHLSPRPMALQSLFEKLDARFSHEAAAKKLWLRFAPTAAIIQSDPDALERILANLIGNAIKYTERGGVWVGYRSARQRIEVRDSGVGIAREHHAKLFDEFFQVANTARDRAQGLGLGLSIVQCIGALLAHEIGFASALHRGSTFWITVKTLASGHVATAISPVGERSTRATASLASLDGALIWVLENDRDVAHALAAFLQRVGARVELFFSPNEAVARAHVIASTSLENKPSAIVSDYRFGESLDGLATLNALRATLQANTPAIILTGDTSIKDLSRIDEALMRAAAKTQLLHKPISAEALAQSLQSLLKPNTADD